MGISRGSAFVPRRIRNLELYLGILIDEATLIEAVCEQFDSVWRREHCTHGGHRQYCAEPIK
ncbi:MAG: hypothetical protein HDS08_06000 [Bacteroides sp.]|nr:hypothetical protein [Bacteroides sp.]